MAEEMLDVLNPSGERTGFSKPRRLVHKDGDYHRAVHVWIFAESTKELLLQKRADSKDSWPGLWDISSAGHISAGDSSLLSARREIHEELGLILPEDAFELIFEFLQQSITNNGTFINNEFNDVYLVTTLEPIPLSFFKLQESEVSAVKYIPWETYRACLQIEDPGFVPYDVGGTYGRLFHAIEKRYYDNKEARSLILQKQLGRYVPVTLSAQVSVLSEGDTEALVFILRAANVINEIFFKQVWFTNPLLRRWLKEHSQSSHLDALKWAYFSINKSPWSALDENKAFLSTADSATKLLEETAEPSAGYKGIEYRVAFPAAKPAGSNFYPPDMDKKEFESWNQSLSIDEQHAAMSFFTVIRRPMTSEFDLLDSAPYDMKDQSGSGQLTLSIVPYSVEYQSYLSQAAALLVEAEKVAESPSLKLFLKAKADAFISNDYYESDIAWMTLDSALDVTIGPYETYEDGLFGYKATFEAFVGVRDDAATAQIKLFGDNLQLLEDNLPLDSVYKSKGVAAAPIRVIHLLFNAGDVKGPQTVAFNLPNDERIVKDRGTSMVILKNVSEAKFLHILKPIADLCISGEQKEYVEFDPFFIHTICHECCHGIGPHSITLPSGKESTVRRELQELYSSLEEAKADIVGLWALRYLVNKDLLPKSLLKSMYVSFLAGCFRSVRFGLEEAHGKGQALQFNWLFAKGGFSMKEDGTFSVNFDKIEEAVESLSRVVMTIQAKGDKVAAGSLLKEYAIMTEPLKSALEILEKTQVPVDITPKFELAERILDGKP